MANTPLRSVRVPDDVWIPAQEKAAQLGETLTDVIVARLAEYIVEPAAE